jgi:predicted small integral membrane protein
VDLIRLIVIGGLASWMTLAVFNNVVGFRGGVAAIGNLMRMQQLRQPPTKDSPLLLRAVEREGWHRAVFTLTLLLEIATALLLWWATVMVAAATCGMAEYAAALKVVNSSLAMLGALLFFFMLGGTWFVYYIHQELLNVSHVAWIVLVVAASILFNASS